MNQDTINIGPNGSHIIQVGTARFFYCLHSPAPFRVRADSRHDVRVGTGKGFVGAEFHQLTLLNDTATAMDVRIAYGDDEGPTTPPPTLCTIDTVTVPSTNEFGPLTEIPGTLALGNDFYRRRNIRIFNTRPDLAEPLYVAGSQSAFGNFSATRGVRLGGSSATVADGDLFFYQRASGAPLYRMTNIEIETDDTINLWQPNFGTPIDARVIQNWFLVA